MEFRRPLVISSLYINLYHIYIFLIFSPVLNSTFSGSPRSANYALCRNQHLVYMSAFFKHIMK